MKITKNDLKFSDSVSYGNSDFMGTGWQCSDFHNKKFDVSIGEFQITKVIEGANGKWYVSNLWSSNGFKTFDGAVRSLLNKLNGRKKTNKKENFAND